MAEIKKRVRPAVVRPREEVWWVCCCDFCGQPHREVFFDRQRFMRYVSNLVKRYFKKPFKEVQVTEAMVFMKSLDEMADLSIEHQWDSSSIHISDATSRRAFMKQIGQWVEKIPLNEEALFQKNLLDVNGEKYD